MKFMLLLCMTLLFPFHVIASGNVFYVHVAMESSEESSHTVYAFKATPLQDRGDLIEVYVPTGKSFFKVEHGSSINGYYVGLYVTEYKEFSEEQNPFEAMAYSTYSASTYKTFNSRVSDGTFLITVLSENSYQNYVRAWQQYSVQLPVKVKVQKSTDYLDCTPTVQKFCMRTMQVDGGPIGL